MSGIQIDVSQVNELARRLAAVPERKRRLVTAAVKHGAQNIKTAIQEDLHSSSFTQFRSIPIAYEMKTSGVTVEADIAPRDTGTGNLANIVFFGTARGGGTHRFYEHGEDELPVTARYVKEAASSL